MVWYNIGTRLAAGATFFGIWAYCGFTYGIMGFALGWMPAALIAVIVFFLWPIILGLAILATTLVLVLIK